MYSFKDNFLNVYKHVEIYMRLQNDIILNSNEKEVIKCENMGNEFKKQSQHMIMDVSSHNTKKITKCLTLNHIFVSHTQAMRKER